jgi:hypothetical protein
MQVVRQMSSGSADVWRALKRLLPRMAAACLVASVSCACPEAIRTWDCNFNRPGLVARVNFHDELEEPKEHIAGPAVCPDLRPLILCVLALYGAGCESRQPPWLEQMAVQVSSEVHAIGLYDGIDQAEAMTIASHYLSEYVIGCGSVDKPRLEGDRWVFAVRTGHAGALADWTIFVSSRDGAVWADGLRHFRSLASFRATVVDDFVRRRL